jgi:hypothetical protein
MQDLLETILTLEFRPDLLENHVYFSFRYLRSQGCRWRSPNGLVDCPSPSLRKCIGLYSYKLILLDSTKNASVLRFIIHTKDSLNLSITVSPFMVVLNKASKITSRNENFKAFYVGSIPTSRNSLEKKNLSVWMDTYGAVILRRMSV